LESGSIPIMRVVQLCEARKDIISQNKEAIEYSRL